MIRAINPISGRYVTATEFLAEVGPNYKKKSIIPECPCNGCSLYIHGASSPNTPSKFSHMPKQNMECRCRNDYDGPLGISGYDSLLFKDEFCKEENIKRIYQLCLSACGKGNFPVSKYVELIKRADNLNIWAYVGIKLWMVPYILLTLDDFTAKSKTGKDYDYRFILHEDNNLEILGRVNKIKISKIFANSQKEIKLFSMDEKTYEKVDTTWMVDKFIQKLLAVC